MVRSRIIGTGSCVPEKVLTNFDLEKMVDTTDEWIRSRTGLFERHVCAEDQGSADLATVAAQGALKSAGVSIDDLDMIIVGTVTPEFTFPATACFVQSKLGGSREIPVFDLSAACSGFLYGLSIADKFITTGTHETILVIGVDALTKMLDWEDRTTCVLFSDGAGAVVVQRYEGEEGIYSVHMHANGNLWDLLNTPGGGSRYPATHETVDQRLHFIKMKGNELFKVAVRCMYEVSRQAIEHNGIRVEDIDLFIPHQANRRIIEAAARRLGVEKEKVYINIHKFGNFSAGTIPFALDEAIQSNRVKPGDLILAAAFGGGVTWGSALFRL